MALPNIGMTIHDGGMGIVPPGAAKASTKIGPCLSGTNYQLYPYSDQAQMVATHGQCKTVEAGALALVKSGPVSIMPTAWHPGNVGSTTHTGTGAATVVAGCAPHALITITITKTGVLGAGEFTYKVGSGTTSAAIVIPAGGDYIVPGAFCTLTFTSMSFTATDVYLINTDGTITKGGSASAHITQVSSPLDDYQVSVKIVTAGALAVSQFQYSIDSLSGEQGAVRGNWSSVITTVSSGLYVITGTGVFLTISGTAVAADEYTFNCAAPYIGTSEMNAALAALQALTTDSGPVHVVCNWYLVAGAAAAAAAADVKMASFETAYKYTFACLDCPTSGSLSVNPSGGALAVNSEADATTIAAFASFSSNRIMVAAGDCLVASAIDGKARRRNASFPIMARVSSIPLSQSPAWTVPGSLTGVSWLYRDEGVVTALDAARFATLRTIPGVAGYFVTRGKMMALSTSDFTSCMNRRVMDEACRVVRISLVPYLNKDLRASTVTGHIDPRDAKQIETDVNAKLEAALSIGLETRDASGCACAVSQTNNFLATNELLVGVSVIPLGYAETITVTIGFSNPAA